MTGKRFSRFGHHLALPVALLVATLLPLVLPVDAPAISTRYEGEATATAAGAKAAAAELAALRAAGTTDRQKILDAGRQLESSAARACALMRTYKRSTTRYGNVAEIRAVRATLTSLRGGRAHLSALTGVPVPAGTARQRATARRLALGALARSVAADYAARKLRDEGLADVLTQPSLRAARNAVRNRLLTRLKAQANRIARDATGGAVVLGVPLKRQVQTHLRIAANRLLSRIVVKALPNGLLVDVVGRRVVRWLGKRLDRALKRAFGGSFSSRTTKSIRSLRTHIRILGRTAPDANLGVVRRRLERAERALKATRFLRADLARNRRRGDLSRHSRPFNALTAQIRITRNRFLLGSALVRDTDAYLDETCRIAAQIRKMLAEFGLTSPTKTWAGKWARVEHPGTLTMTQSGSTVTGTYDWFGGGTLTSPKLSADGTRLTGGFSGGPSTCASGTFGITLGSTGKSFGGSFTCAGGVSGAFSGNCIEGGCLANSASVSNAVAGRRSFTSSRLR